MRNYMSKGLCRDKALGICQISRHQFYYKPTGQGPGRRPSTTTPKLHNGHTVNVANTEVVEQIRSIHADADTRYGYRKMCVALMLLGYFINHKKVYRLMQTEGLLRKRVRCAGKRNYVRYRVVVPKGPLQVLEMDIKYVWVHGASRHAYVLTILDTFTRMALYQCSGYSMNHQDIIAAWEHVIIHHLQPADMLSKGLHIEVRNDNGPQFAARATRTFFADNYLEQVFTHPYTPEENGHIESFHNTLSDALEHHWFDTLDQLRQRLIVFYEKYNNIRLHSAIANLPPRTFWDLWEKDKIKRITVGKKKVRFTLRIPYQKLSGNMSLREASCSKAAALNAQKTLEKSEVTGPGTLHRPSVQHSPSVASC